MCDGILRSLEVGVRVIVRVIVDRDRSGSKGYGGKQYSTGQFVSAQ